MTVHSNLCGSDSSVLLCIERLYEVVLCLRNTVAKAIVGVNAETQFRQLPSY